MAYLTWKWRDSAACAGVHGRHWGRMEFAAEITLQSGDRMPRKRRIIETQIQPALVICAECPVFQTCREWAESDNYSGIAGGELWRNGKPMGIPKRKS